MPLLCTSRRLARGSSSDGEGGWCSHGQLGSWLWLLLVWLSLLSHPGLLWLCHPRLQFLTGFSVPYGPDPMLMQVQQVDCSPFLPGTRKGPSGLQPTCCLLVVGGVAVSRPWTVPAVGLDCERCPVSLAWHLVLRHQQLCQLSGSFASCSGPSSPRPKRLPTAQRAFPGDWPSKSAS